MSDPIDFQSHRNKARLPPLTPEEKQFDAIVFAMRDMALPALIDALFAARDERDLAVIVAKLADYIAYCITNQPRPA
jgi:hypothetical protein